MEKLKIVITNKTNKNKKERIQNQKNKYRNKKKYMKTRTNDANQ